VLRLAAHISRFIPPQSHVLDVGCGDGELAYCIKQTRPEIAVDGLDVLVRPSTKISVRQFDGCTLPFPNQSIDVVLLVDVLHHTRDPNVLLREASRVARNAIVLKDHCLAGFLAAPTLRLMDWVGNASYGISLPYNYWTEQQWRDSFRRLGLAVDQWHVSLRLYPWPASYVFDRSLHFIARLHPEATL
jgi:SAM-dependent methyltransferase